MTRELVRRSSILGIVILFGAACGDDVAEAPSIRVTLETPSGSFIARIVDPVSIDRAREALDKGGSAGIPNGRIVEDDGGVNTGHNWHLEDVELVDVTIEACDGQPTSLMKTSTRTSNWAITAPGAPWWLLSRTSEAWRGDWGFDCG